MMWGTERGGSKKRKKMWNRQTRKKVDLKTTKKNTKTKDFTNTPPKTFKKKKKKWGGQIRCNKYCRGKLPPRVWKRFGVRKRKMNKPFFGVLGGGGNKVRELGKTCRGGGNRKATGGGQPKKEPRGGGGGPKKKQQTPNTKTGILNKKRCVWGGLKTTTTPKQGGKKKEKKKKGAPRDTKTLRGGYHNLKKL